MLEINNLTKRFDKFVVFDNISLKIADGSIFGLVGINGAGKSTLLRCIAGVYHPEQGEIFFNSQPVYENIAVKKDFFFLPDEPYASVYMTGIKLESIYSSYYHEFDHALYDEILKMFQIDKSKKINTFSKGMKRRLYLALAFACKPKLLMLDEAFDGLDPLARLELKKILIKKVEEENLTVIISSHSLRELEDICDSYALLDDPGIQPEEVLKLEPGKEGTTIRPLSADAIKLMENGLTAAEAALPEIRQDKLERLSLFSL